MRGAALIGAALATALTAAACSTATAGGGRGSAATSPPVSSSSTLSVPTASTPAVSPSVSPSATPSTPSASSASGAPGQSRATRALLTAAEIGGGFTTLGSAQKPAALPCRPHDRPVTEQVRPAAKANAGYRNGNGRAVVAESVAFYRTKTMAAKTIAIIERGLACSRATLGTGKNRDAVQIDGPLPVGSALSVPVDKSESWTAEGQTTNTVYFVTLARATVVVLAFTVVVGTDTSGLPSTEKIIDDALRKAEAA
jgi:hypothetical protein